MSPIGPVHNSPESPLVSKTEYAGTQELRDAAVEFESLLIDMMMKSMRSSVPESGLFGDESHTRMYQEMQDTELSKVMARQGGLGLADTIVRQFSGREGDGVAALRTAGREAQAAEAAYRAQSHLAETGVVPLSQNPGTSEKESF